MYDHSPMRQHRRFLIATVAAALFIAPVAAVCSEAAMVCDVAVTSSCDEMPAAEVAVNPQCHTGESTVMKCCESDSEALAVASPNGGLSSAQETPGRSGTLPAPDSPRPEKAASSISQPRSSSARYVLLESFLL